MEILFGMLLMACGLIYESRQERKAERYAQEKERQRLARRVSGR